MPKATAPRLLTTSLLALLVALPVAAEDDWDTVGFDSERWTLVGGEVVEHMGRQSLRGRAKLRDIIFSDGIIEVEIAVDGSRCFPGVGFRMQDDGNFENFYIRPHHHNGRPHALQYTPVVNGISGWQIYNGRGFTARADIPWQEWIRLRIEVSGSRARIYLGDLDTPALVVSELKHGESSGYLGLIAPPSGQVHFANFRYRQTDIVDLGPVPVRATTPGLITDWQIAGPFDPAQIDRVAGPDDALFDGLEWRQAIVEPSGLVNLSRHVDKGGRIIAVALARTTISSPTAQTLQFDFGYSDELRVFLNGDILFAGNGYFRSRDAEFIGVAGLNDSVFLQLEEGSNELLLMVTEVFGGWGIVGRLSEPEGGAVILHDRLAQAWQSDAAFKLPESVVYGPLRDVLYVTNMNMGLGGMNTPPAAAAESGFVSRLQPDGRVDQLEWIGGLRAPTGMAVHDDTLYVVERTGVVEIDASTGDIVTRHAIDHDGFLNDVAVDGSGTVYISDSRGRSIYRISAGEVEIWLEAAEIDGPNGLLVDGDQLVIASIGTESLVFVDLSTRRIDAILGIGPGTLDGLQADGADGYIVSKAEGEVLCVDREGRAEVLLDSTLALVSTADFAFVPDAGRLVIPTLYNGRVVAYDLVPRGPSVAMQESP